MGLTQGLTVKIGDRFKYLKIYIVARFTLESEQDNK